MSGTNPTTHHRGSAPGWKVRSGRSIALVLAVVLPAVGLLAWLSDRLWSDLGQLEMEVRAVEAEAFDLGLHARNELTSLKATLLRVQLSKADPVERERFNRAADALAERIARTRPLLATAEERKLATDLETAFQDYRRDIAPLLERGVTTVRRDSAGQVESDLAQRSGPVLAAAEQLVLAQQESWTEFLRQSEVALGSLRRSTQILLLLLAGCVVLFAWMGYRAGSLPLRAQLDEARASMLRQEKLASLGTLAAGVAHEIRNPLAAVKFRLFSLRQSLPPDFHNLEDVQVIGDELNRLNRIVGEFLQFARPSVPVLRPVLTGALLRSVDGLLKAPLAARQIELRTTGREDLGLRVDQEQMEQVLINLVQNAAESIGSGGRVELRAREGSARLAGRNTPAVLLEVEDTGPGIPPEVQERLFDPFFSTKESGTGLGLAIAERIVESHQGQLQYQTEINRGTVFQVVLPHSHAHPAQDPAHRG